MHTVMLCISIISIKSFSVVRYVSQLILLTLHVEFLRSNLDGFIMPMLLSWRYASNLSLNWFYFSIFLPCACNAAVNLLNFTLFVLAIRVYYCKRCCSIKSEVSFKEKLQQVSNFAFMM